MIISNKHIVLLSLGLIIFSGLSCQKSDSNSVKIETDLKGSYILENELQLISLHTAGDYLIGKLYDNDYAFAVYSLSNLDSLGRIGKIGDGPDEYKGPLYANQYYVEDKQTFFWVNKGIENKLDLLSVEKSLEREVPHKLKVIELHPKFNLNQYSFVLDDNTIIGNAGPFSPEAVRLQKINLQEQTLSQSKLIPKIKGIDNASSEQKYQTYFGYLRLKPNGNLLVSALKNINRIDVFDTDLNLISTFEEHSDYRYFNVKYINDFSTSRYYYRDVVATENHIIALRTEGLFQEAFQKHHDSEILIFDWDLELKNVIRLNDYLISIAFDVERSILFGLDYYNERYLKYDLNHYF